MRIPWSGAAVGCAALLLLGACGRGPTEPNPLLPGAARQNTAPKDSVRTTSGGYYGSGLRNDPPPSDSTQTVG